MIFLAFAVCLPHFAALPVEDLAGQGVPGFLHGELGVDTAAVSLVDGVDERQQMRGLGDAGGRLTFHIFAAMAEFVGDLISENTRDGLEAARSRGRVGGRKAKLAARQLAQARKMYDDR